MLFLFFFTDTIKYNTGGINMNILRIRKYVAFLLLFVMLFSVFPLQSFALETNVENEQIEAEAESNTPEQLMPIAEAPRDHLLCRLVGDRFIPYDPDTDDPDADSPMDARPDSTYKYSDIFSAHSADMNGNKIKAGGAYTATTYGANDTAWFPAAGSSFSKELSFDGTHYVCIGAMYANQGPYSVSWESGNYCGLAIRPSQEDGYASTSNSAYYIRGSGVPSYKLELLKTKHIPQYTQEEFTVINLIYAVANGMGGMDVNAGSATHIAAAYTLVMNVVLGYIGLGSDYLFHGLPIATTSTAVNKEMCEILVRCEVYSREKLLGGSATGDNTLARLKAKLNYTPTDMTDYTVKNGAATYEDMRYLQINKSTSSGNQIYIWGVNSIEFTPSKPVALKKTIQASGSALACIQGNPLYSLAGAEYAIYKSYVSSDTLEETLITDANGNATSAKLYPVGTVLYAVEAKAPPGYLKTSEAAILTVSADASENVFCVSDTPSFDPEVLKITKTGADSVKIQGAVFQVEFFAAASPTGAANRTWYFQSDTNGVVKFDDTHLASGYTSDALFKPDSSTAFPLGCIKVTEVKAAQGYSLPSGNNGTAYIYIRQNQNGIVATAAWGDVNGNPVTTIGMYTVTNDTVTAVNTEVYGAPFTVQKADPSGASLEGAIFRVDYFNAAWFDQTKLERTWYFKTDSNGFFTLDAAHLALGYTSSALFDVGKIPLGVMAVREWVAPTGYRAVSFTGAWRIKQASSGSSTVKSYWAASDCEMPTSSYGDSVYILDADPTLLYVKNAPLTGTMVMQKTSPEGNVEGYCFRLYRHENTAVGVSAKTWYGKSDAAGNVYNTDAGFSEPETRVYTFTDLLDGTYAFRELLSLLGAGDVWPESITFTTSGGITPACERTFTGDELHADTNGDCTVSNIVLTGLNGGGQLTVAIHNKPIADPGSITVHKVDEQNRPLSGVTFCLDFSTDSGATWAPVFSRAENESIIVGGCTSPGLMNGLLVTGSDGFAAFCGLHVSTQQADIRYRLTEVATLPGYGLLAEPVYVGSLSTAEEIDISFTVVNMPNFQLPQTGGSGFIDTVIGIIFAGAAALTVLLLLRKRRGSCV